MLKEIIPTIIANDFDSERRLRLPEVKKLCPYSTSGLYKKIAEGTFPKPIRIGSRAVAWKFSDIQEYLKNCEMRSL